MEPDQKPACSAPSIFAVGTALTGGPPHRSQRALLTHWAPTSGHDAQSLFGIRVQCSMLDDFHRRCCTALAESEIRLWWWPRYVRA